MGFSVKTACAVFSLFCGLAGHAFAATGGSPFDMMRTGSISKEQVMPPVKWASRCVSETRQGPSECAVEHAVLNSSNGQLLVAIKVRLVGDERKPVMLIRLPVGLNLPAGLRFQVDEGQVAMMPLQTCDGSGCLVSQPLSNILLNEMKRGQRVLISFQNLHQEEVAVPVPLGNFAESFSNIE